VIDDDDVIGTLVRMILSREGFEVVVCEDGLAGLRAAGELRPDVVLVDSTMPGMSGAEVVAAFEADPAIATIPLVVMSADWLAPRLGLRKPFSPEDLVATVRRHLPA